MADSVPTSAASRHLTFRTNDGARCFTNCPACRDEREAEEGRRLNAARGRTVVPYRPWMDEDR